MADTPNTSRPSDAIQRYNPKIVENEYGSKIAKNVQHANGEYVNYWHALAWVARAREEARREALEEAARCVERQYLRDSKKDIEEDRKWATDSVRSRVRRRDAAAIRALGRATPTPQGESRVDQKRPPPPEDLVDALQDRVHPASGPLIQSKPVTPQGETKEND